MDKITKKLTNSLLVEYTFVAILVVCIVIVVSLISSGFSGDYFSKPLRDATLGDLFTITFVSFMLARILISNK